MRVSALVVAFGVAVAIGACAHAESVTVETRSGAVTGVRQDGVDSFKGLPYAVPPTGALRWRPPQPAMRWNGARDASNFAAACAQDPTAAGNPQPQSEDCLFLNVWAPARAARHGLPVLIWIHGGGNVGGAGSQPIYDGTSFARDGIVTVTINYRLGLLGYFAHPALWAAEPGSNHDGNFGLMDQIAAIKWVRRNISAFGGDPNRITIAGQSAGGEAILLLMTSSAARGLYSRAIAESAPGLKPAMTMQQQEKNTEDLLAAAGLPADVDIATLRSLPPSRFFGDYTKISPYIDGSLIKSRPIDAFRAGTAARVPLLIGTVTDEGSLVAAYPKQPAQVIASFAASAPTIRQAYGELAPDEASYERQIYADSVFGAPARAIAELHSKAAPTYLYRFGYMQAQYRGKRPGAWHVSDVLYEFKTLGARFTPAPDDVSMSDLAHRCWVTFIKGSAVICSPTQPWPAYSASTDQLMLFGIDGPSVVGHYRKPQFDLIDRALLH
jgi:para-nitrobenzyl esterase